MNSPPSALYEGWAKALTPKYIWTFIQGIFFLYMQILLMPSLEIMGVIPNILLPWMIYTVWKKPLSLAIVVCFVIALLYDVSYPLFFGLQSMLFVLLAVGIDLFRIPFEEKSVVARLLTIALVNIVYALLTYLTFGLQSGFNPLLRNVSLLGFLYNLMLSLAVFWFMIFLSKLRIIVVHE